MDRKLILCFLFVTTKGISACTEYEIVNCMRGISELVTNAGSSITTEGYIYSLTNDEVKEFCSIYNSETRSCLDNLKNSCPENVGAIIEGGQVANRFMCGEGLEELLQHKNCIGKNETFTPMLACEAKFKQEAAYITDTDVLCRKADELVECTQRVVREHCGNAAATWLKKYERIALKPILDSAGCSQEKETSTIPDPTIMPFEPEEGTSGCTVSDIQKCVQGISELVTNAGSSITTEGYIYSLTNDQVMEFCRLYNSQTIPCTDNLKNSCPESIGAMIEGDHAAERYLCGDGLEELLRHKDCMGNERTLTPMLECQRSFKEEAPFITDAHILCRKAEEAEKCTVKVVRNNCGTEAATWLKKLERLALKQLLDRAGCHQEEESLTAEPPINDIREQEATGCTESDMHKCMGGILELVRNAGSSITTKGYIYSATNEQVTEFCRLYNSQARPCTNNLKNSCPESVGEMIEASHAATQYLCGEGLKELLRHKDCLGEAQTLTALHHCERSLTELPYITDKEISCRKADEAEKCTERVVRNHCGNEAATWLLKLERLMLKQLLDKAGCQQEEELPSHQDEDMDVQPETHKSPGYKYIYIAVGSTLGLLLLLVTALSCIRIMRSKKDQLREPFSDDMKA